MKALLLKGAFICGMTAVSVVSAEVVMDEQESNHPIQSPMFINHTSDVVAVNGRIGNGGNSDLDFYSFFWHAGDVVSVDIDNGYNPDDSANSVRTTVAIFSPDYKVEAQQWMSATVDEGSVHRYDPRIETYLVPADGIYVVGVSNYPRTFVSGGGVVNSGNVRNGSYTLVVSGMTVVPQVTLVSIDVKPGTQGEAPINPKSRGKIPVAILSSDTFDALTVVPSTLTFGATGSEESLSRCHKGGEDVNSDGRLDLVCHFENQKTGFGYDNASGTLRGKTEGGEAIEGTGFLKVVPAKGQ